MRNKLLLGAGIAAALCVGGLATATFSLNALVQTAVERFAPPVLGVSVRLGGVSFMPFSGSGKLSGLEVANPPGFHSPNLLRVRKVRVDLEPGSLLTDVIVVRRVEILAPQVAYELGRGGSNLDRVLEHVRSQGGGSGGDGGSARSKRVKIGEFVIKDAKVAFGAAPLAGLGAVVTLAEIRLTGIGGKSGGATAQEAAAAVLGALNREAAKAVGGEGKPRTN